jgi:endonuclease YncB( thermonuclease family)
VSFTRAIRWLALVILGAIPQALLAAVIHGRVVGVSDGDTVKVLDAAQRLYTVRLMGIDAPEKTQPFGQRSKQSGGRRLSHPEDGPVARPIIDAALGLASTTPTVA